MNDQTQQQAAETPVNDTPPVADAGNQTPAPEAKAEPTIAEIMEFDPFGPSDKSEPADKSGKPTAEVKSEPKPGEQPKAEETLPDPAAQKPAEVKPDPATPPAPSPEVQALQQQIAILQQTIANAQNQQPAPAAKPGETETAAPKFNLALPPQMIKALRSEDDGEFGTAMHAVINGIANKVWTEVQQHIASEVIPGMSQIADRHYQVVQQRERVQREFYGSYPQLNKPELRQIVQSAGVQVAQERAALGQPVQWDENFAKAVAGKIFAVFPALQVQQQQQQQTPPPLAPKQPFQVKPGTRPAPSADSAHVQEMMDVLQS